MGAIITTPIIPLMWVADMSTLGRDTGRQPDFDYMGTLSGVNQFRRGGFTVKLGEAVSIGEATDILIDELQYNLKKGDKIDFGFFSPVTLTVGAAGASAGAVSVPVTAVSGPIPAGQVIHLGTNKFVVTSADIPVSAVPVSIAVLAIPTALVGGDTGTWQGGRKELVLSADAEAGATEIDVEAPKFSFLDNAEGWALSHDFGGDNRSSIFIPESTVMVEVNPSTNRKIIPLVLHPDGTSATGQVMVAITNMKNDSKTDALTGYGVTYSGNLWENLMHDAIKNTSSPGNLPTGWKTLLGSRYIWLRSYDSRGVA